MTFDADLIGKLLFRCIPGAHHVLRVPMFDLVNGVTISGNAHHWLVDREGISSMSLTNSATSNRS